MEREHLSVFLVTHDLEEAITVSDTVYLLSRGRGRESKPRMKCRFPGRKIFSPAAEILVSPRFLSDFGKTCPTRWARQQVEAANREPM